MTDYDDDYDPIDFGAEAQRVADLYHDGPKEDLVNGIYAALVNVWELSRTYRRPTT